MHTLDTTQDATRMATTERLQRHQLAWPTRTGWHVLLDRAWDPAARDCIRHWAAHDLPLVVARQASGRGAATGTLALGLPAPGRWQRRRLAVAIDRDHIRRIDDCPRLDAIGAVLPPDARADAGRLAAALRALGVVARVFGSHGWQMITGLDHLRPGSDLDLLLAVDDAGQADACVRCLQAAGSTLPRLDGELMFADGAAVAWREWLPWRAGERAALMVKTIDDVSMVSSAERFVAARADA